MDDRPTCGPCQAALHAAQERRKSCPRDMAEMSKEVVYDRLVIDVCPDCKGIWLDPGELEVLQQLAKDTHDFQDLIKADVIGRQYGY